MAKFCVNCGNELFPNMNFCSNCGQQLNNIDVEPIVPKTEKLKSKNLAGILGIFLGWCGAHNFYLGYTSKAIGQLLLTILTCGVLSFLSEIWGLIEGIMILTDTITVDGKGNKLLD